VFHGKCMNICLVSQEYPPETARGGIGTQTWNKAKTLARLGHSVHVLSSAAGEGPDLRTEIEDGITVHRMAPLGQERGEEFPIYNSPTYWLGYTWSVLRHLNKLMCSRAFDVIDFAEYGAEGYAYQLDRTPWNWAPVVVQLHAPLAMLARHIGWPEQDSDFYRVGTFMEGISIKLADGLMACSTNLADFTASFYGVPRESIDVVHCGVDAEAFRPWSEGAPASARPTVLFVGNIAANKGVETAFEAVLRLRSKFPAIRLKLLGKSDDGLQNDLLDRARAEGAASSVEFDGFVDRLQLPNFYRQADVLCLPSQHESLGIVYLEAMACGCPVVATTAGGAPEAVVDGETGILVPPLDVSAVRAALDLVLSDASLRRRMGEAGRKRVENYFAMDKYILRILAAYQKAIDSSRTKLSRSKGAECVQASVDGESSAPKG
jgi:glycosyltransferase involved in cell wall biosynthesis